MAETNVGCSPACTPSSGFSIEAGYPTWDWSPNEARATIKGWVPWADLTAFVADMFPPSTIVTGVLYQYLGKAFPGLPNLRATNLKILPYGGGGTPVVIDNQPPPAFGVNDYTGDPMTLPVYDHAYIEITYENVKNQPVSSADPVPYLTHRWAIGGEVLALGKGGSCWDRLFYKYNSSGGSAYDGSGNPILTGSFSSLTDSQKREYLGVRVDEDTKAHIVIPHITHEITWPRVINPPFTAVRQCVQHVNNANLTLSTGVVPPECMLFLGGEIETVVLSDGSFAMNMKYRFQERQIYDPMDQTAVAGWNHFYHQGASSPNVIAGYGTDECRICPAGFYRLERMVNTPRMQASACSFSFPTSSVTDLSVGYHDETAIYQKANFANLFKPEP